MNAKPLQDAAIPERFFQRNGKGNDMKKIRWGILSTANIGRTQVIPAIIRAGNADVHAIASRTGKVHAIARQLNIPNAYESYEGLLQDPEIDAVYIPLPNHMHKEWVIKAAKYGKHVLCEKPAALTREEAEEMIAACHAYNVKFMEAFMYQLHPQHKRVREILLSGEIGDVKMLKSSHSFYLTDRMQDIRMDKTMGGGSLYDLGCYSLSVIRFLSQSEPVSIFAEEEVDPRSRVDLSASVMMKLANGWRAVFDCSFDMVGRNEYEIIGTRGSVRVPFAFRPDLENGVGQVIVKAGDEFRHEEIFGDIYREEIEQFSEAIRTDSAPPVSTDSTVWNMEIIGACQQSMQTGKRLKYVNGAWEN